VTQVAPREGLNHAIKQRAGAGEIADPNSPAAPGPAAQPWSISSVQAGRPNGRPKQERVMDKDRVEGAMHQAKGKVKEAAGKVTGDKKTQSEGTAEKAAGKVQNSVGGAKDAAKDWADR
jgi:uncharacterized protein YjbJ (UPF0337 family)